jgi:hypothetical protein
MMLSRRLSLGKLRFPMIADRQPVAGESWMAFNCCVADAFQPIGRLCRVPDYAECYWT